MYSFVFNSNRHLYFNLLHVVDVVFSTSLMFFFSIQPTRNSSDGSIDSLQLSPAILMLNTSTWLTSWVMDGWSVLFNFLFKNWVLPRNQNQKKHQTKKQLSGNLNQKSSEEQSHNSLGSTLFCIHLDDTWRCRSWAEWWYLFGNLFTPLGKQHDPLKIDGWEDVMSF